MLVEEPEGKRPLGRPSHRWEDTIDIIHKEIGSEDVDCIHQTQDEVQWRASMNMLMNLRLSDGEFQKQVYPHVIDSSKLPRDTRDKVTVFARPLLAPVAQKLCMCKHSVFTRKRVFILEHYFA
jgi:hypothetical protein